MAEILLLESAGNIAIAFNAMQDAANAFMRDAVSQGQGVYPVLD